MNRQLWFKPHDFFDKKKSFDFNHDLNQWLKSAQFKSANPGRYSEELRPLVPYLLLPANEYYTDSSRETESYSSSGLVRSKLHKSLDAEKAEKLVSFQETDNNEIPRQTCSPRLKQCLTAQLLNKQIHFITPQNITSLSFLGKNITEYYPIKCKSNYIQVSN